MPKDNAGLAQLEQQLRRHLRYLNFPAANWVKGQTAPDGRAALDVAIIGGGACGLALAFALMREGVQNFRIFDRSPEGQEGPWVTTARMRTLRSPKHLTGPNLGLPDLTFRAWFEATEGAGAWEGLDRIPREQWMDYLRWYRKVLEIPVENNTDLRRIDPACGADGAGGLFRLALDRDGVREDVFARHVVLATGRAAFGGVALPDGVSGLPRERYAHTEEDIDFGALTGKSIVVVGAAASAADNAAMALEAGAREVRMLIRAPEVPRLNKFKGIVYPGYMRGYCALEDALRWQFLKTGLDARVAPPRASMLRLKAHPGFHLHTGSPIHSMEMQDDQVVLQTGRGERRADFVIFGTGYAIDVTQQPELAPFADDIRLWRDAYHPPEDQQDDTLLRYPYLGEGFQFLPKPGHEERAAFLERLHLFNAAATLSHAPVSSDIPGINTGTERLVDHLVKALFKAGQHEHLTDFIAFDEPELLGDEWEESRE
ncbi:NAD(P)-binding domain-containing protein [Sneathiella chinensis]|uniref:Oxidoreductase n=1 Tax=Sneathiella chinensis TaxID=349750 RepID=A0ABQ5U846_9PROT|nr:NAD(P)/FAD-dependent oxidoreductase [Sneathiella chinensis]GLQ07497.1 oxidoreductase [Sneathiella chinensis]